MDSSMFFKEINISSFQRLVSNNDSQLLIQYKSDELKVLEIGNKITTGLPLSKFKAIFSIEKSNIDYELNISNYVSTIDGIKILGKISCVISIKSNEEFIKRVFKNEKGELTILNNQIQNRISNYTSSKKAKEIKTSITELNELLYESYNGRNGSNYKDIGIIEQYKKRIENKYTTENECCFDVKTIVVKDIQLEIKEIDNINSTALIEMEKKQKDDEINKLNQKLNQNQNELKQMESEFELKLELEKERHKLQLELENGRNKLKLEQERELFRVQIENAKRIADLEFEEKRNQIEFVRKSSIIKLMETEEGKIVNNPELWYELQKLIEQTKALNSKEQQIFAQDFIKTLFNTKQSYQQGERNILKKVVERVFNIQVNDNEDATNPILDSLKQDERKDL